MISSQKIYIVEGQAGEYSAYRAWPVRAFLKKKAAEMLRDRLNKVAAKLPRHLYSLSDKSKQKLIDAGDPYPDADYNGVEYSVYELELEND